MKRVFLFILLVASSLLFAELPKALQGRYKFVFPMEKKLYKVCDGKNWGVVDENNEVIISIKYHQLGEFSEDLIKVRQEIQGEKYWGYMNAKDTVVVKFIYREADDFRNGMARVRDEWKYGYIDKQGTPIIPLEYDLLTRPVDGIITYMQNKEIGILDEKGNRLTSEKYFPNGIRKIYLNGRYGYVNPKGEIVVPIKYEKIANLAKKFFSFWYKGQEGVLVPYTNKIIVPSGVYDDILEFKDDFFYVKKNEKMGLIDTNGVVVLAPDDYDTIFAFTGKIAKVCKDEKYGIINKEGAPVVPAIYDNIDVLENGYIRGTQDDKYFPIGENATTFFSYKFISDSLSDFCVVVMDGKSDILSASSGEYLTKNRYDYIGTKIYEDDLILLSDNKRPRHFGFVNLRSGKETIPIKFETLQKSFFKNLYFIREDGKMGLAFVTNDKYRYVIKPQYEDLSLVKISPKFLRTKTEKGYGLISEAGQVFLEAKYDNITPYESVGAKLEFEAKFGAVNDEGKIYVPVEYIYLEKFNNQGYLIAKKLYKYGVLDDKGKEAVPFEYDRIDPVFNGISVCMINGGYGFLGYDGKVRTETKFQSVEGLSGDVVLTKFARKYGVLSKKNKEIVEPVLDAVVDREDGFILLTKGDKVALMSNQGKLLTPFIYQAIGKFREGYAMAKKEGRYGFIDMQGKEIIPTIYNRVRNFVDGISFVNLNGQPLKIDKQGKIVEK